MRGNRGEVYLFSSVKLRNEFSGQSFHRAEFALTVAGDLETVANIVAQNGGTQTGTVGKILLVGIAVSGTQQEEAVFAAVGKFDFHHAADDGGKAGDRVLR